MKTDHAFVYDLNVDIFLLNLLCLGYFNPTQVPFNWLSFGTFFLKSINAFDTLTLRNKFIIYFTLITTVGVSFHTSMFTLFMATCIKCGLIYVHGHFMVYLKKKKISVDI